MANGAEYYRRFYEHGDEEALAALIRDYKDGLILYLYGMLGDIHEAEELIEDTFVLLCIKRPRDKGGATFKTWLYTVARRKAIDRLRRRARRREVPQEVCIETADQAADVEAAYLREERRVRVYRAMEGVSPACRQVLWLTYFEGMSNKQTAAVMRKSVHAVETLLYRARKALKTRLETEGFPDEDV